MCGRSTLMSTPEETAEELQLTLPPDGHRPRYSIAPVQPIVALRSEEAARAAVMVHWGVVPVPAKDPAIGSRIIDARLLGSGGRERLARE